MTRLGRAAPSRKPFSVPLRQLFWGYSAPPLREYSLSCLLSQCESGSREPNQFGSMRIRIRIPIRLCRHKKLDFHTKIYFMLVVFHKTYLHDTKAILKGWKSGLFVNFGQFPCSWIRICIPTTDPDPGEPVYAYSEPQH
jgi:hypothetical protein